jgi:hypothetical protein
LRRYIGFYGTGLSMAMVGYLGAGAFLSVAYYPYPWMLSAMAVAWQRAGLAEIGENEPGEANRLPAPRKDTQP